MKLGFSSCCYPHRNLLENLLFAKEQGFDFVECMNIHIDEILQSADLTETLNNRLRELPMGLTIHHALPPPDNDGKVAVFKQSIQRIYAWLTANSGLAQVLSFDTWVDRQASLPLLLWVLEMFKDMDIPIATEDYPLNARDAESWKEAMAYPHFCILSDLAHTNVRLCDTGDQKIWCLWNEGENLPLPAGDNSAEAFENALRKKPRPSVEIHIHNNNGLQDQHLSISDGTADYSKIVPVLKKIGFDGLVNIETTPTIHGIFGEEADKILLADRDLWRELWKSH